MSACGLLLGAVALNPDNAALKVVAVFAMFTAWMLRRAEQRPAVLGPFYSFERRAVALSMVAFALVAVELATRAASSAGGAAADAARELHCLLYMVGGYVVAALLTGVVVLSVEAWWPVSALAYRMHALDAATVTAFFLVGTGVLWNYTHISAHLALVLSPGLAALRYLANHLPSLPILAHPTVAKAIPSTWPAVWHVAFAAAILYGLGASLQRFLMRSTRHVAPIFANVISRGSPYKKMVALTFNGGPVPGVTSRLLQLLKSKNCRATFFLSRADADSNKALVAEIVADGHEVGCLGLAGPHWTTEVLADVTENKALLEQLLPAGAGPIAWYRPQDGSRDARALRAANRAGLGVALWSATPYEWDATREQVTSRLARQMAPMPAGHVVALQHRLPDYLTSARASKRTALDVLAATEETLAAIHAADPHVRVVTLSELLPNQGEDGQVHTWEEPDEAKATMEAHNVAEAQSLARTGAACNGTAPAAASSSSSGAASSNGGGMAPRRRAK